MYIIPREACMSDARLRKSVSVIDELTRMRGSVRANLEVLFASMVKDMPEAEQRKLVEALNLLFDSCHLFFVVVKSGIRVIDTWKPGKVTRPEVDNGRQNTRSRKGKKLRH
jgi:hypothetical protein